MKGAGQVSAEKEQQREGDSREQEDEDQQATGHGPVSYRRFLDAELARLFRRL